MQPNEALLSVAALRLECPLGAPCYKPFAALRLVRNVGYFSLRTPAGMATARRFSAGGTGQE